MEQLKQLQHHADMPETMRWLAAWLGLQTNTFFPWRRGEKRPRKQTYLPQIVEIGAQEAAMSYEWAEAFLREGGAANAQATLVR